jgi:hypothetical protein
LVEVEEEEVKYGLSACTLFKLNFDWLADNSAMHFYLSLNIIQLTKEGKINSNL